MIAAINRTTLSYSRYLVISILTWCWFHLWPKQSYRLGTRTLHAIGPAGCCWWSPADQCHLSNEWCHPSDVIPRTSLVLVIIFSCQTWQLPMDQLWDLPLNPPIPMSVSAPHVAHASRLVTPHVWSHRLQLFCTQICHQSTCRLFPV